MQNKLTRHHIVPKSMNWSNTPDNIKKLKDNIHRALHILFSNQTPVEQMETLMYSINTTALTYEFKNDIWKILSIKDDEYFYKNWILIPKHYKDE